jgi:hypothetical protein
MQFIDFHLDGQFFGVECAWIFIIFLKIPCSMIRYNPSSQLSLEGFKTPFSQQLSASNSWVVQAKKIPWIN